MFKWYTIREDYANERKLELRLGVYVNTELNNSVLIAFMSIVYHTKS